MQFLKTLFLAMILVAGVIFAYNNWIQVTVSLWGGLVMDTSLPVLLLAAFLIGFMPTLLWHRASRWNLNRKLGHAERALAETKAALNPPAPEPVAAPAEPLPPGAAPIAVPPGVS